MHSEPSVLARQPGFGSVAACGHGFVHVQLGLTTLTLTEAQYLRFVAMVNDSAASFELERQARQERPSDPTRGAKRKGADADFSDFWSR